VTDPELRFEFVLARELHMTVGELRRRMSTREFAHWIALYRIEAREREAEQRRAQQRSYARRR